MPYSVLAVSKPIPATQQSSYSPRKRKDQNINRCFFLSPMSSLSITDYYRSTFGPRSSSSCIHDSHSVRLFRYMRSLPRRHARNAGVASGRAAPRRTAPPKRHTLCTVRGDTLRMKSQTRGTYIYLNHLFVKQEALSRIGSIYIHSSFYRNLTKLTSVVIALLREL